MRKIIELLSAWAKNIVIFIIIISFLEMILPNGNIGKFVKITIGLIIILVIINPFIKLVQGDIDIEKEVFKNIENQYSYREEDKSEFIFNQDEQIKSSYIEEIKTEIERKIINKTKYKLKKSNIIINENKDSKEYGCVESIELELIEDENKNQSNNKEDINKTLDIEDINIDINIENKTKTSEAIELNKQNDSKDKGENSKEIEEIRTDISKQFEMSKDKIFISSETKE